MTREARGREMDQDLAETSEKPHFADPHSRLIAPGQLMGSWGDADALRGLSAYSSRTRFNFLEKRNDFVRGFN